MEIKFMKDSILLNETNWNEVFQGMHQFPFRISEIKTMNKELNLSPISFKYNLKGKEIYKEQKHAETLHDGDYLLATNVGRCEIHIHEKEDDLGVCVDVNREFLKQAFQLYLAPNDLDGCGEDHYWLHESLFTRYRASASFQQYLQQLFYVIKFKAYASLPCLEMDFISQLLQEQLPYYKAYRVIPLLKAQSKNELYHRLLQARNMMQDRVFEQVTISEIAKAIYMSEFRFHHMYKEVFGVSPHKDMLQFKCHEALRLHEQSKLSWTEIALRLDFADLPTFSKAFKRITGITPSKYTMR